MNYLYLFCTECLNTHKENIIFCVWAEHLSQWLRRVNFAFQKINGIAVYILLHRCKITFFVCNSFQCTNYPSALTNKAGQPFFFFLICSISLSKSVKQHGLVSIVLFWIHWKELKSCTFRFNSDQKLLHKIASCQSKYTILYRHDTSSIQ